MQGKKEVTDFSSRACGVRGALRIPRWECLNGTGIGAQGHRSGSWFIKVTDAVGMAQSSHWESTWAGKNGWRPELETLPLKG